MRVRVHKESPLDEGREKELWNTHKFEREWERLGLHAKDGKSKVVLVSTGALNPVHLGHVQMLERARAAMEGQGFTVVGGWLSPSHDLYVRPKCIAHRTKHMAAAHRLACVDLAVADSPWISTARWESREEAQMWPDFPEVCDALRSHLHRRGFTDVVVAYVCGADHFDRCGLERGLGRGLGVVVVARGHSSALRTNHDRLVFAAQDHVSAVRHVSSTAVREGLAKGKVPEGMLHPAVERYLLDKQAARALYE